MDLGIKLGAFAALDTTGSPVTCNANANGSSGTAGSSKDLGSGTRLPARCRARFALTQSGTTNSADLVVRVQHSSDGSAWPDTAQGDPIFAWKAASAGADLTRSQPVVWTPKSRYYRFVYDNFNGTDSFTMSSEIAEDYVTDT